MSYRNNLTCCNGRSRACPSSVAAINVSIQSGSIAKGTSYELFRIIPIYRLRYPKGSF